MLALLVLLLVAGLVLAGTVVAARLVRAEVGRRGSSASSAPPWVLAATAGGALAVAAAALLGAVGLRSGPTAPADEAAPDRPPAAAAPEVVVAERVRARPPDGLGPVVTLFAANGTEKVFPFPPPVVDRLEAPTVLQVRVGGFEPFATGRALQCAATSPPVCANQVDVQFGEKGEASFQYLVDDGFAPGGGCGRLAAPCSVVVEAEKGGRRAVVVTVFHDRAAPLPRVEVTPRSRLADRQAVVVRVSGLPPGAGVGAALCAAPDLRGPRRCAAGGGSATTRAAPDGTATMGLTVEGGRLGTERVSCGEGTCGVVVTTEDGRLVSPAVLVTFAAPSGAHYRPARVAVALAALAAALGLAAWLLRRTDWSPVGEEAAPEIDEAEYADLDAIVAALPPEAEVASLS